MSFYKSNVPMNTKYPYKVVRCTSICHTGHICTFTRQNCVTLVVLNIYSRKSVAVFGRFIETLRAQWWPNRRPSTFLMFRPVFYG